ncbi:hypothetical protein [Rhodococcus pyridinivorans]|uniref:hypothetical protein n=1 Tax=Rhodococcus pyridinivorans TaxID=103816 RepID=UPI003AAFB03D
MLVDRENYWLNSEYASWVTDPNDREVKEERLRRQRLGIKPPPMPLLPPVALRPPDLAQLRLSQYDTAVSTHMSTTATSRSAGGGDIKAGSVRELLQILDARDRNR